MNNCVLCNKQISNKDLFAFMGRFYCEICVPNVIFEIHQRSANDSLTRKYKLIEMTLELLEKFIL